MGYQPPPTQGTMDANAIDVLTQDLREAVIARDVNACERLLRQGADPDASMGTYHTIFTNTMNQSFLAGAELMLEFVSHVDAPTPFQQSPLSAAASNDYAAICEGLIRRGASVNASDSRGFSALYWAAAKASISAGRLLIDAGADLNPPYKGISRSIIHHAMLSRSASALDFVQLLLQNGADLDFAPDSPGAAYVTPFQYAMANARTDVARYLIEQFPTLLDKPTLDGRPVLEVASEENAALIAAHITERSVGSALGPILGLQGLSSTSNGMAPL